MMDIEKLIEQLNEHVQSYTVHDDPDLINALKNSATALSTLQAENEKLRAELEQAREKNAGLALALLTECAPNPDCLGDDEWRAIRAELEQMKAERDAAVNCIYKIEGALDCGNDNDWAREHISEWESQKEN